MAKRKFNIDADEIMDPIVDVPAAGNPGSRTKSLENLRPRQKGESPKKYMQLNIYEFEDYLNRMSKYKKMTRTKYILSLIAKDYAEHEDEYKALKLLTDYDN